MEVVINRNRFLKKTGSQGIDMDGNSLALLWSSSFNFPAGMLKKRPDAIVGLPNGYLTFFRLSGIIACIRGGCSSVVERQIVDLVVVGSNPITHPFTFMLDAQTFINQSVLGITENAPVAQLDRATDFESVGRTFEPCRAHVSIPSLLFF